MHKNYNSCLHILDMHVERGRHQFSHRKQILVEHCYTQNIKAPGLIVSEKIFVCFSYCKYMGANVPWGGAILNPRDIIDRIYVKHHITLPHTK